jgi:hypothetical protein
LRTYLEKAHHKSKNAGRVAQAVTVLTYQTQGPEFKPQCHQKKKKSGKPYLKEQAGHGGSSL